MTNPIRKFTAATALALSLALAFPAAAQAQTDTTTTTTTTSTTPAATTSTGASGAGFGVGAAAFLTGPVGDLPALSLVYDLQRIHFEGMLALSRAGDPATTAFFFGARGWYHLHDGTNSDFSLGGGLGFLNNNPPGDASDTFILLEPGMQARVFLTPNFTLNAVGGLSFVFGDADAINLGGQLMSSLGFTYFFR